MDDGVKIDGIIDDSIWENANYLTSSFLQNENADDSFPKMQITAVPGQYGVYINSVMYDNNIVMYSEYGAYAPRYTTGWQIHFLNIQRGEDIMSISTSEMAVRVKNFTLDSWGNLVFNTPELQGLAAIKIDGVVNSGNTNSITMETFISYESMQLDVSNGIPDTFYMYPINRSVFIGRTSASEMQPENLYNTWQPSYYYSFNEHGFVDSFADNFVLGNAPSGLARTAGWEYFDDDTPSVKSTREQAQTVYFSEVYADSFVLETDIEFAEDITHFTQNKQTVGVEILSPNGNGLTFVVGDNYFDYDRHQYDKYMIQIGNRDFATSYATGIMDAPIE